MGRAGSKKQKQPAKIKKASSKAARRRQREKLALYGDKLLRLVGQINRDRVSIYAAQASFFFIISAVPFLMLLLSMVQYIMPVTKEQLLDWIRLALPDALQFFAQRVVEDLYTSTTVPLVSVTAVTTLWIASKGVYALVQAMNEMYHITDTRSPVLVRAVSLFDTLLVILILLGSLAAMAFGGELYTLAQVWLPAFRGAENFIYRFHNLISIAVISLLFAFLYRVLPNTGKIRFKSQLPGAFVSAMGWLVFSFFYEIYLNNFAQYSVTYGSLGAVVLMMLWLYTCLQIFLVGAEINLWLLENSKNTIEHGVPKRFFP